MESVDVACPGVRLAIDELGEVGERGGTELEEVLALEVALAASTRDAAIMAARCSEAARRRCARGAARGSLRSGRRRCVRVPGRGRASSEPDRLGRHRVTVRVVEDGASRAHLDRHAQRQVLRLDLEKQPSDHEWLLTAGRSVASGFVSRSKPFGKNTRFPAQNCSNRNSRSSSIDKSSVWCSG